VSRSDVDAGAWLHVLGLPGILTRRIGGAPDRVDETDRAEHTAERIETQRALIDIDRRVEADPRDRMPPQVERLTALQQPTGATFGDGARESLAPTSGSDLRRIDRHEAELEADRVERERRHGQ
jgi:hypothetical protein